MKAIICHYSPVTYDLIMTTAFCYTFNEKKNGFLISRAIHENTYSPLDVNVYSVIEYNVEIF